MTHLSREQLLEWRDHGAPADRERVLGHLAACEPCRRELSELARLGPVGDQPSQLDPRQFLPRGVAAWRGASVTWLRRPATWMVAAGAVAAAVLIGVVFQRPAPQPDTGFEIRSDRLLAIAPAGEVASVSELRWSSPYNASRYRVSVRSGERVVATGETAEERFPVTLTSGSYTWTVEALDANGRTIAASKPQAFRVR